MGAEFVIWWPHTASNSWLESVKILEKYFKRLHKNSFKFKNNIITLTAEFLMKKVPEVHKTLIQSFSRQGFLCE
jgi:hypothetical protein